MQQHSFHGGDTSIRDSRHPTLLLLLAVAWLLTACAADPGHREALQLQEAEDDADCVEELAGSTRLCVRDVRVELDCAQRCLLKSIHKVAAGDHYQDTLIVGVSCSSELSYTETAVLTRGPRHSRDVSTRHDVRMARELEQTFFVQHEYYFAGQRYNLEVEGFDCVITGVERAVKVPAD